MSRREVAARLKSEGPNAPSQGAASEIRVLTDAQARAEAERAMAVHLERDKGRTYRKMLSARAQTPSESA
jgi:hypothetical protein